VEFALRNENLANYEFKVNGKSNKDDGYLGNITFVTVTGTIKNGIEKAYHLVIKSSKESINLRNQIPIKEIFEKEIYIYDKVKTAFEDFLRSKGIEEPMEILPYCYGIRVTNQNELVILEDLRIEGFKVSDRKVPMTFNRIKATLEAFGKWNAMSLALKKGQPEVFSKLIENNVNSFSSFLIKTKVVDVIANFFEKAERSVFLKDVFKTLGFNKNDIKYILTDMLFEDPDYQVILHGDSWTNNFMYKLEDNKVDVRIIDWQLSGLASPIIDLSYFIYCCCSKEDYKDLEKLLKIYHQSLSESLKQLGCDINEVFPFVKLIDHWKRFSKYGLVISIFLLKFSLCEGDEAPDFAETAEQGKDFLENFNNFNIKNEEVYLERVKQNLLHYTRNSK